MSAPQSPVKSRQTETTINGISTQVVCTAFSNYIFIVLTQYGKIGTLVSVTPDSTSSDISSPMISTRVLLGKDEYGKIGTLVSVTPDSTSSDISSPMISTRVLLGKDEALTHVCAKNLATFVSQEAGNRPVLLGLSLKDTSIEAIKCMKGIIKSCQVW